jgi:hypothetical protein
MDALESVDRGLAVLGRALGLSLALGPERACGLRLDNGLECSLEVPEGSSVLHLYCPLLPVPPDDRLAFLEDVLALNLYGLQTGGASLALDPDADRIVLCWSQPPEGMLPEDLAALISGFVERATALKARLEPAARAERGDGGAGSALAPPGLTRSWRRG